MEEEKVNWDTIKIKTFKPYEKSKKYSKVKDMVEVIITLPTREAFKLKRLIETPIK